ncbi:MAG: hypothetical protein PHI22_03795 [Bacilli bacterium]|nr:hypothetical protein [Bacilli bacterium]MDD4298726.1 hypothetical protein [Bacilli bacterium]MDD4643596.1 hypothetical protein [Bacilli bacterium]
MTKCTVLMILITAGVSGITSFLMKKFKGKPLTKYFPTFAIWFISFISFMLGTFYAEPIEDLAFWIISIVTGLATIFVLIATIAISRVQEKKLKSKSL